MHVEAAGGDGGVLGVCALDELLSTYQLLQGNQTDAPHQQPLPTVPMSAHFPYKSGDAKPWQLCSDAPQILVAAAPTTNAVDGSSSSGSASNAVVKCNVHGCGVLLPRKHMRGHSAPTCCNSSATELSAWRRRLSSHVDSVGSCADPHRA